ncbi:MAG TPA: class I SAM-dependent methyltransferase [Candidatus Paceibacterota bacterium]|jgi:ubiquinone/menaquinone biosynthesis C-methylase UbiE
MNKVQDQVILNKKAGVYDLQQILNGAYFVYRHIVKDLMLNAGDSVLDIGCGTGTVLRQLQAKYPGARLHGIDPSKEMVEIARRKDRTARIDFTVGFAQSLEFPDRSIDCVISSLTTHHVSTDIRRQMFREVKRVLKPGGLFYLTDFHSPSTPWGRAVLELFLARHAFIKELVAVSNTELLMEAGFVIESAVAQQPIGIAQHIRARTT